MPEDIALENSELIGLWLQLLGTGAYLAYVPRCIAVFRKNWGQRTSYWLPAVCTLIFLCTISDQVLALISAYSAYSVQSGRQPNPSQFYADPATALSISKNSLNVVLTFLSDVIIVYRAFIVWGCRLTVVAFPFLLVVANLVLGVFTLIALAQTGSGDDQITAAVSVRFKYYTILTFGLNLICAGLICMKIWKVNSKVSGLQAFPSTTRRVLEVVIQSAGIYCAYLLALIVTNAAGTNIFFTLVDPLPPITAGVFSMMIVRARDSDSSPLSGGGSAVLSSNIRFWQNTSTPRRRPMSVGIEIDLERTVYTDNASVRQGTTVEDGSTARAPPWPESFELIKGRAESV